MVGRELTMEPTKEGDWVRAQLDKASQYCQRVKRLTGQGVLGLSSGAIDHKVKVAPDGTILRWPVVERR